MSDDTVTVGNTTYYQDANGYLHSTPQEAVDANLSIESVNGQYVTGGNCGQSSDNIKNDNISSSSNSGNSNSNSSGK